MVKVCEQCNEEFNASRSIKRFCGQECAHKSQKARAKPKQYSICQNEICGKEFEIKSNSLGKFCSRSCSAVVTNKTSPKRKPQGICAYELCGLPCNSSRTYCSTECREADKPDPRCKTCGDELSKNSNSYCRVHYNERMRKYVLDRYYLVRAEWIDRLGGRCVECGIEENLEFDHIIADDKEFYIGKILSSHSSIKVEQEMKKCQLLCEECHLEKSILSGDLNRYK